ncbi:MAG: YcgN family cysteine cluster protein [Parvibaculum sp.]|uniref:YcgN family cysteine cluster protein n=1 Tax=Parvibaculum sp. TaxID=2024848 RepID=UPI002C352C52|nr:YcgN family cysteine cluster protein [Parvibaculum sp.]HMM15383.1 YcgN family cysteine cluster protein [Parvibaculum sp.]
MKHKSDKEPFWKRKTLEEMTRAEWESLCDGCAKCCLVKLEDEDTLEILFTDAVCKLLDGNSCRCTDYANRSKLVPDCVHLTPKIIREVNWMPPSCAYRLIAEGKDLPSWHPLVSGETESVHRAGMSVRGRTICESEVEFEDICDHIVEWPTDIAD